MEPGTDVHTEQSFRLRRPQRLSPEEDALIIAGENDDDDIDETLPADLWFRAGQRRSPPRRLGARSLSTGS